MGAAETCPGTREKKPDAEHGVIYESPGITSESPEID